MVGSFGAQYFPTSGGGAWPVAQVENRFIILGFSVFCFRDGKKEKSQTNVFGGNRPFPDADLCSTLGVLKQA